MLKAIAERMARQHSTGECSAGAAGAAGDEDDDDDDEGEDEVQAAETAETQRASGGCKRRQDEGGDAAPTLGPSCCASEADQSPVTPRRADLQDL